MVRNDDLTVAGWKPGPNCELQLPTGSPLRAVRVWDTWDGGCQTVEVCCVRVWVVVVVG